MFRKWLTALTVFAATPAAFAHFVFVVPAKDGKTLTVVMSETLEPDDAVSLGPVAALKLHVRGIDGKETPIALTAHDHRMTGAAPVRQVVYGSLDYGVTARAGQAFLLKYHPKSIVGGVPMDKLTLKKVAAEIIPERSADGLRFRVLAQDAPAVKVDVTVILPDGSSKKVSTDDQGRTPAFTASGRYGAWVRVVEKTAGEYQGQKYAEIRHYPTLVFDHSAYPPLPEAVSSFGAAVADDYVYVFGGHRAKVHSYDTNAVTGAMRRLRLTQPNAWEELPPGPPLQGTALVAHAGKLIRVGGMLPHNKPGTKSDMRSTDSCAAFDPAKNAWEQLPALPKPRSSHDASVVGDTLVVVGGWNMRGAEESEWFEDALMLDLKNPNSGWKSVPQPFARRALQTGSYQNKVYVAGGLDEDGGIIGNVSVFDPATKSWSEATELPGGKKVGFNPGICSMNGRLYVSVADGTVARLSVDGKSWETISKLAPRIVHRMVPAADNTLLLIGGALGGSNLDAVEAVVIK